MDSGRLWDLPRVTQLGCHRAGEDSAFCVTEDNSQKPYCESSQLPSCRRSGLLPKAGLSFWPPCPPLQGLGTP